MQSGDLQRARSKERNIAAGVRAIAGVTSQVADYVVAQADNEAKMQAISETARMNRTIEEQRRALQMRYLEDEELSMDSYLADDEKLVNNAVSTTRGRLSKRASRYAEQTLASATSTAYTESRYKFFTETSQLRTDKHMLEFTIEAQEDIKNNPAKGPVYFEQGTELLDDLHFADPRVKDVTERRYRTSMVDTTLYSMAQHGQYNEMLAVIEDDRYNNYITDVEAARQIALAGVSEQFVQEQNASLAAVSRDPRAADPLYETIPASVEASLAGTDFQVGEATRTYTEKVANQQLQSMIFIKGDLEEAERRLNAGFYDDKLPAEDIGDWMAKLVTAQGQAADNKVTLDLHRADRVVDGVKNGDKAAADATGPVIQELENLETNPNLSESQRISVREKRIQVQTYAENPHLFGDEPTQYSRAELDATIASVDSLLVTPEGEDFESAAARTDAVNAATQRLEGLKREFDTDPAAYLIKYNPDIRENYTRLLNAIANVADPEQQTMLPNYLMQHVSYMDGKQAAEWSVANEDVTYFPKNHPLVKNLVTALDGMDLNAKMTTVGFLASSLPPAVRTQFMHHMGLEDPGTAAAVTYASKGLVTEAENQLRGAQRRASVNALGAKVVKDGEVTEGLRRVGGIPFDALPEGGGAMYAEVVINEYYAIASEEEINSGVPQEETLRQARLNTWGEVVDVPFSVFPDTRMLSYRRADNSVMMTPAQVQGQLSALRDSHVELIGQPRTLYGGQVSQEDLIIKGRFIPVGNGRYQVVLPEAVLVRDRLVDGYVLDENDKPYILDLNQYPVSTGPLIDPDFGKSL
jgi:hypothetical protein